MAKLPHKNAKGPVGRDPAGPFRSVPMLIALVAIVMIAFAANSVLTRWGIFVYGMDALLFSGLRLASGAAMLGLLVALRGRGGWPRLTAPRMRAAGALLLYLLPFSMAYVSLPSGVGALILFGVVQLTMFAGSALTGVQPRRNQWVGMALALFGLCWLLWPSEGATFAWAAAVFMVVAGIGWGLFSLGGRGSQDPLADMAWSFVLLVPVACVMMLLGQTWPAQGVVVAVICGAVTSGLGYALWYLVLPRLAATTAAVAQLSVPVLAIFGGALFLGEVLTAQVLVASAIVLGGIGWAVLRP